MIHAYNIHFNIDKYKGNNLNRSLSFMYVTKDIKRLCYFGANFYSIYF